LKKYFIVLMVSLLFFGFTGSNSVLADVNTINLAVNGMLVDFPDQKPYIDKNNRTMVPVRFPAETLGANVDWLSNTRQVHIVNKAHDALKDTDIMATIDRKDVIVNGQTKYMDTTAVITNSRTMVPVRFISEYLGAAVTWHDASRAAHVFTKGQTKEEIAKIEEQIAQELKKQKPQPQLPGQLKELGKIEPPGSLPGIKVDGYETTIPFISATKGIKIESIKKVTFNKRECLAVTTDKNPNMEFAPSLYFNNTKIHAVGDVSINSAWRPEGGKYVAYYYIEDRHKNDISQSNKIGMWFNEDFYFVDNLFK